MLENQCRTWPDPIVAAVYVPLVRGRDGGRPAIPTYRNTTLDDVIRGERGAAPLLGRAAVEKGRYKSQI